jgi:hypothetical protein
MKCALRKTLFWVLVCFACYQFSSSSCFSLDLAIPENGQLVPYVHTNKANTVNTLITLTNKSDMNQTVNYTYFNKKGQHVYDSHFPLTPFDTCTFDVHEFAVKSLSIAQRNVVFGGPGYMVFAMDDPGSQDLLAHAVLSFREALSTFLKQKQEEWVSIPVLPVQSAELYYEYNSIHDVMLTEGHHGVNGGDEVMLPYDLTEGRGTKFVFWVDKKLFTDPVVMVFDEDENGFSFSIPVDPDLRLIVLDMGKLDMPFPDYEKGFILAGEFYPLFTPGLIPIPGSNGIAFSYIHQGGNASSKFPRRQSYAVPGAHWPNP